jgi:non-ribosomal peptide synthetase component F
MPESLIKAFTMPTLISAAWAMLIASYTGSSEAVFGTVAGARQAAIRDIERIADPTIAIVPVRVSLDKHKTVQDLLVDVQEGALQTVPYEHTGLQVISKISREANIACVFQTLLVIHGNDASSAISNDLFALSDIDEGKGSAAMDASPRTVS